MADLPTNVSTTQAPPVSKKPKTTAEWLAMDFGDDNSTYSIAEADQYTRYRRLVDRETNTERFIVVTGSGKNVQYVTVDSLAAARKLYIKEYAKHGGIPALKKALYKSGYISKREYDSTVDFVPYLDEAIRDSTIANVQGYSYEGKQEFIPLTSFLTLKKGTGTGTSAPLTTVSKNASVLDDTEATALAKRLWQRAQGRDPNAKELKEVIPMIQEFQRKNPSVTTTTRNKDNSRFDTTTERGGDPEQFLLEKLSQKNETKAHSILGYYDAFKQSFGGK